MFLGWKGPSRSCHSNLPAMVKDSSHQTRSSFELSAAKFRCSPMSLYMKSSINCLSLEITSEILESNVLVADTIPQGSVFLNFSWICAASMIPECFLILMEVYKGALVYWKMRSVVHSALVSGMSNWKTAFWCIWHFGSAKYMVLWGVVLSGPQLGRQEGFKAICSSLGWFL